MANPSFHLSSVLFSVVLMENGLKEKLDQIPEENNLMEKRLIGKWSNWKLCKLENDLMENGLNEIGESKQCC